MEHATTACILIDTSSPLWNEIQTFLKNNDTDFAESHDVTFRLVAENRISDLETEISEILRYIGVPTHIYGYQYLITAIELAYYDKSMLHKVTKDLYPVLAKRFRTTTCCVERNIRQAICISWRDENIKKLCKVFHYIPYMRPSNSEYISMFVDYLRYRKEQ